jgi:hypothetical protein
MTSFTRLDSAGIKAFLGEYSDLCLREYCGIVSLLDGMKVGSITIMQPLKREILLSCSIYSGKVEAIFTKTGLG